MHDISVRNDMMYLFVLVWLWMLRTWPMWNYMLHIAELGISVS